MKLPCDLSGEEVASLLAQRYGYRATRTRGSHVTVTLTTGDDEQHSVTVPRHRAVHVVTLNAIVGDVARFLGKSKKEVLEALFG